MNAFIQLPLFDTRAWLVSPKRRWRLARRARVQADGRLIIAGGLIFDGQGRVLLLRRSTPTLTQWETPGGKLNRGETPQQTAVRELQEELGVTVELTADLGAHDLAFAGMSLRYALFEMRIAAGVPRLVEPMFEDWRYFTWVQLAAIRHELSINARNIVELRLRGRLHSSPLAPRSPRGHSQVPYTMVGKSR